MSEALEMALSRLVRVTSETPESEEFMQKMTEIIQQPGQDYSKMIVNPLLEEFHELMAPIYSEISPIMEDLYTTVFNVLKPIIFLMFRIVELSGPFIIQVRDLLGLGSPSSSETTHPNLYGSRIYENEREVREQMQEDRIRYDSRLR